MKRPLRDISIQASPSCVSHQVEYEAETLGAASSESPLSAVRCLARWRARLLAAGAVSRAVAVSSLIDLHSK